MNDLIGWRWLNMATYSLARTVAAKIDAVGIISLNICTTQLLEDGFLTRSAKD